MRDFMAKEEKQNEHDYEGNGRLSGAIGKSTVYGIAGTVGGSVIGATVGAVSGGRINPYDAAYLGGKIAGGVGSLAGLVHGWQKADTAIKNYDNLAKENEQLKFVVNAVQHQGGLEYQAQTAGKAI